MTDEPTAPQSESHPNQSEEEASPSKNVSKRLLPSERQSTQSQAVSFLREILARFMPFFLSLELLAYSQTWMQQLMSALLTLITGLGGAYGQSFIDSLIKRMKLFGNEDAENFGDCLKKCREWPKSYLFKRKYLKYQGFLCESDDSNKLDWLSDGVIRPRLRDIFVPLELTVNSQLKSYEQWRRQSVGNEPYIQSIWDVLKQVKCDFTSRQILIRAKGGYGKTTLLKYLTYIYCKRDYRRYNVPKLIPFLILLAGSWRDLSADNAPDLPGFLNKIHLPSLPQGKYLKVPPNWILDLLKRGEALVMFDGFDEVPLDYRLAVSQWINRQMRDFSDSVFIITSRPDACLAYYDQPWPSTLLWVHHFSEQQQQKFIWQWYGFQETKAAGRRKTCTVKHRIEEQSRSLIEQLQARPKLGDLAGNPLLLNIMCRLHRKSDRKQLPQHRVDLYRDICELQTAQQPKDCGIPLYLSPAGRLEVLQSLALAMMLRAKPGDDQGHKQITENDLLDVIAKPIGEHDPDVSARNFLRQMVEVSELLVKIQEKEIYEFSYLSFQEFLAASEIKRLHQESILYDKFSIPSWKATILLYGELVNPSNLIRAALQEGSELSYKIAQTALKCSDLSDSERKELTMLNKIASTSRYSKLVALMQAEDWQAADQETYRLMITAVGKEEGDFFTINELLNFPCEELLAIDQFWVQHSQGKFGFSVQKEIYVDCGAKLDGKYPGDRIWEEFGDQVGWRENNQWKSKDELIMNSQSSLKGGLPITDGLNLIGFVYGEYGGVSSLASRLVNCSRPQS